MLYLDRGKLRCQGTMAELLARGVFRDNTNTSCRTVSSANGTGPAAGSPTMASPVSVHQQADAGGVGEGDGEEGHDEAEEVGQRWSVVISGMRVPTTSQHVTSHQNRAHSSPQDAFLCMLVEGVGCPVAAAVAAETMTSMTMAERKTAAEAASIISREEVGTSRMGSDRIESNRIDLIDLCSIYVAQTKNKKKQRQSGSSGAGPYAAYIEGMGGVPVALGVLLLMASAQLAAIFSNLELSAWVKLPYAQQQERTQPLATYLGLVGAVTVLAVVRALVASERMLRASQRLHDGMIHALLRTPIAFYDTNPEGRIVNRTTKVPAVDR